LKAGGPKFSGLFKGTKLLFGTEFLFDYDDLELVFNPYWLNIQLFDTDNMNYDYGCFSCDRSESEIQKDDFGKLTISFMEEVKRGRKHKLKHFVYPDGTVDITIDASKKLMRKEEKTHYEQIETNIEICRYGGLYNKDNSFSRG
jgi:hypothetical protein